MEKVTAKKMDLIHTAKRVGVKADVNPGVESSHAQHERPLFLTLWC